MRMEWAHSDREETVIRDCETGKIISEVTDEIYFPSGILDGDTFHVTGVDKKHRDTILIFSSKDLQRWEKRVLLKREGWYYYNTCMTKDDKGYALVMEAGKPSEYVGEYPFTFFFATSPDLKIWNHVGDDLGFSQNRYMGGPWMRYSEGWYYVVSVTELPCLRYANYIYRTRDFKEWQIGFYNPMHMPGPEDLELSPNAADITPEFYEKIQKSFHINVSDMDMCDYNGKLYINYCCGNQQGFGYIAEGEYDGTMAEFLKAFFE